MDADRLRCGAKHVLPNDGSPPSLMIFQNFVLIKSSLMIGNLYSAGLIKDISSEKNE